MSINPTRVRSDVPKDERWNLSALFTGPAEWEAALKNLQESHEEISSYAGTLGESADNLLKCLKKYFELEEQAERLGYYAFLRVAEDQGDSDAQSRQGRFMQVASKVEAATSFIAPEIQTIPADTIEEWIKRDDFADFRIYLTKLLRYKPHILSDKEEKLLAMQGESNQTPSKAFNALLDVDIDFGMIDTPEGPKPLTNSTLASFMQNPDRDLRKKAFEQYHGKLVEHRNTIASLYAGSINQDIYQARVRNYSSSLEAALFPDNVDPSVYHNLVKTISDNLSLLHKYYEIRKRVLKIDDFSLIDTRVPLVGDVTMHHSYDQAVELIGKALAPLGEEYTEVIGKGLKGGPDGGWVDKYENKGKRSGAFSAGSFHGEPYILMNFKEDLLRDVFTLAHEGGHSMHSWYSSKSNPFPHYNYTIFEAEVASTFNEQLLFTYMMKKNSDPKLQAYLINKQIDDMIGTIFRQTMFAEYELRCHELVESGQAMTVQSFREEYLTLLKKYFGPAVALPEVADMEGLRIPHFYRAFYVYKYATGLSAAIALSQRVLNGGDAERDDYFKFLKSGGSRFPIDALKVAGVDMSKPEPVENAMKRFGELVDQLDGLLA
jgi:oligoendopeptidase F